MNNQAQNILETYSDQSNVWKLKLIRRLTSDLDERLSYFLAVYLTSRKYIDFFALLPDKLSLKILSFLDPKSLLALSKVFSKK